MLRRSKCLLAGTLAVIIAMSLTVTAKAENTSGSTYLYQKTPSAWSSETINKAIDYSDEFKLEWNNVYTDSITRGQFGVLIDAVLTGKAQEFPEYNFAEKIAVYKAARVDVETFEATIAQYRDKAESNKVGADAEYKQALDLQLEVKADIMRILSEVHPEADWLTKYEEVLLKSRLNHFNDTQTSIAPYCEILYNAKIARGTSNTTFEPNKFIKRQEAAVMMYNLTQFLGLESGVRENKFDDDEQIAVWAKDAVYHLSVIKASDDLDGIPIMAGIGNNLFDAHSQLTIEQSMVMVYRLVTIL